MTHHTAKNRRAFTLIELLVVVGIIALLIAISVPMLIGSYRKAQKTKASADMMAIRTALDAYHTDFGDYPYAGKDNGFAILGMALMSPGGQPPPDFVGTREYEPGECVFVSGTGQFLAIKHVPIGSGPPIPAFWQGVAYSADGKAGPGFKVRQGGKEYGPYLQNDRFRLRGLAILDVNDNPILYFRAASRKQNPKENPVNWLYVEDSYASPPPPQPPFYDAAQNIEFFMRTYDPLSRPNAVRRMEALMIENLDPALLNAPNHRLLLPEAPVTMEPYLLWGAGGDGLYGVTFDVNTNVVKKQDIDKCDDITNFR